MTFPIGALVAARGRDWVVLPDSDDELLLLKPLGGRDEEVTGILPALEPVASARFAPPNPELVGDHRSGRLLREAVRLGFRASAGPFRSFGRIAVEPRPYQLVPLLLALRLDPVRLLIADDVGIGKTVEAALIARELLDRGEVSRLAVLCPPHLAEQWQEELADKFRIDAELLLPSTVRRLENRCRFGESLYQRFPHLVISIDFIKSERYRHDFLRHGPELAIVDEAHGCASGAERGGNHQRHELARRLAADPDRHLLLVTATPHSGNEDAFRSLLTLLQPEFADLPADLSGEHNRRRREQLARYLVQRRRADIRRYLDADTPFPERRDAELSYALHPDYRRLFERALAFARETVREAGSDRRQQRIRWWSVLALLRSLASSPAAAAATLRNRAAVADAEDEQAIEEAGRHAVMDLSGEDAEETPDIAPGADLGDADDAARKVRRRLRDMAREAEQLVGDKDVKLQELLPPLRKLLKEGFKPIVFCRYIPTVDYVAAALRETLGRRVEVAAVTGQLPPAEREQRVLAMADSEQRILVATDCLSEGINLQGLFDAVVHYDLAWNPTRHEQREGRVDRYGQASPEIRVLTYYGRDNQIDGIVLDVLLRKHKRIRSALGVSVPIPVDSARVMEAIFESLVLRGGSGNEQYSLPGFEPVNEDLALAWQDAAERERRSRTLFAQETLRTEEVAAELAAARDAVGRGSDVAWFVREALAAHGAAVGERDGRLQADIRELPVALRDALPVEDQFTARFELPVHDTELHLHRTHPLVEQLAAYVVDTALDRADPAHRTDRARQDGIARRCGAIRTARVERRTTVLLLRLRFKLITTLKDGEHEQLAEDCRLAGFTGSPDAPDWLPEADIEQLLQARPDRNIEPQQARNFLARVLDQLDALDADLQRQARDHGQALQAAHQRIRRAARAGGRVRVEVLPVDVLGVYLYLPAVTA